MVLLFLLLMKIYVIRTSTSGESTILSDVLKWKYTPINLNCTNAYGSRNPCRDARICNLGVVSLMMGGWPTLCGWVGKDVPKICCGLPLVLGGDLMAKIDAEKSRNRICGIKTIAGSYSETENRFQKLLKNIPPVDISHPENFDPPLDLPVEMLVSPVGGRPSRQGDFPWMLAIFKGSSFWCGGSLIDRKHILSAAHCVVTDNAPVDPSIYSVRIGNIKADGGFPFPVVSIKVHEGYIPNQYYNDIAILTLPLEILQPFIAQICLPNEELSNMDFTGKNTTLLGWGDTEFGGRNAPSLHIVDDIPVVSNSECQSAYSQLRTATIP